MIEFETTGSFRNTDDFLSRMKTFDISQLLSRYGAIGVDALSNATPFDTGETAGAWYFRVTHTNQTWAITFYNHHTVDGRPIAILLQYGHATGTGGWVEGRNYINPAILPLFDKIAADAWKEVTRR